MSDNTTPDLELVLDSLAEGVCAVDCEWRITIFNRAAQTITGISEEMVLGKSFTEVFSCELCECRELLSGVMKTGRSISEVNTRIANINRQAVPINLNATPLLDKEDRICGLVATFLDNRPIEQLRRELTEKYTFADIVTKSPQMQRMLDILPDIAQSESTVLITGESGTGKELVARAIHQSSPRANQPFIAVNCGALPDNLLESELFGYLRGAFTDAKSDKPGRFALAEGGTLFLDEIGDISPAMQVRLLRVLQEKTYEPLGASKAVQSDVRIITATNRDLTEMLEEKQFRSDLYYRINVIEIPLPPLRERVNDIPLLVEHFLSKLKIEKGLGEKYIQERTMARLIEYDYPGNIRELENIIERAYILSRGNQIKEDCLPPQILDELYYEPEEEYQTYINLRSLPDADEQELILATLRRFKGNRKQTAKRLGINPSTLWRKMKKHNII